MDFNAASEENTLNWRQYLDVGLRYKWLIIIPTIIALIVGIFVSNMMPKVYRAKTLILVEDQRLLNPLVEGLAVSTKISERLSALREELLSWPRLVQLIEKLGLDKDIKDSFAYESLVNRLKNNIRVEMRNKANVIEISFKDEIPLHAQNVVRAISDILIEKNLSSHQAEADEAILFIEKQLGIYREKLEKSEDDLRKFKEVYMTSLPIASRVNQQIIDLEIQLNTLLIECTQEHPAVIALKKKIALLKGEKEKEMIQMEGQGIDINSAEFKDITYSVPRQQQELAQLQRDTKVNAAMYEKLLQRLESARISKTLDKNNETTKFKVIEPARLPLKPFKPQKERIILFAVAIGLGLGCGLAFLLEVSNNSFRSLEQAKKVLPLPILGAISKIEIDRKLLSDIKRNTERNAQKSQYVKLVQHETEIKGSKKDADHKKKGGLLKMTQNCVKGIARGCGLI